MTSSNAVIGSASVLGTGAIGSGIANALLAAGATVTVWNRTPARTDALVANGAIRQESVAAAAAASPLVFLCFTGYSAVNEVLDAISGDIAGRTVVALTTGSPEEARSSADQADQAGAAYLDGGVQTAPEDIGTAAATFLYSGAGQVFDQHKPALEVLGAAKYVAADPGAAAVQDLALFGLWYDAQLGYLRALDTVRSVGIDIEEFAGLATAQLGHVVDATADTARELVTGSFPRGPASLGEHAPVVERLKTLRHNQRLGSGGLEHVHPLIEQHIRSGRGHQGLTSILEP